ncbi:MAG: hypothetical protein B6D61_01820 [Bacteroidetes bacterium 4484_249]|nr:MAG: hypothetical protein B6D61_01820 [Bacteroidetes bacterium 4484_249]
MKTSAIFLINIFFFINIYASDWVNIKSETPVPNSVRLISSDIETSVLQFNLEGFYKNEVQTSQGTAYNIRVDDCAPLLVEGAPDLCLMATSVIIPDKGKMEVRVISSDFIDLNDIEITPSRGSLLRNTDPATVPFVYGRQYNVDSFFPQNLAELRKPYILRDHRGQAVLVYPFQYNPVTKVLRVHYNITVEVKKYGEEGLNQKYRDKAFSKVDADFDEIYSHHFINYNFMSSKYDPVEEEGSMLIISYGDYINAMQPFVIWKREKGIDTEIIDIAEIGNDTSDINPYIRDKYYNDNLKFVLLIGDYSHITSPIVGQSPGNNEGGADNLYGYIEGNDHYSEVIVGRFSAESVADVETQVERSIYYEKEIPETDTWLNKGLGMGSNDAMTNYQGYHDWDHIRELIRADLLDYTYVDIDEFYDGTHGGEDLPGDPNAQMVIDKFDEGIGILVYSGHAGQSIFSTSGFSTSHAAQLQNTGMLPHVWVLGCNPGEFNSGYCLAESLARAQHNSEPAGALTSFMSSTSQMWDPPYLMEEEMVDILTEQKHIKRSAGALAINGCMEMNDYFGQANWGYFTTDTWIFFGDPSLIVRTDIPVELTLSNNVSLTGVPFTTVVSSASGPVEGAKVCISQNENYYLGITDETGNVSIENELMPGTALIVVTAYNAETIYQNITVIPPDGPYVIFQSVEINDETGNNNQLADYGETAKLTITVNNVGTEQANDVIVSVASSDEFVTVTDGNENYGNIPANETATVTDGFEIELDNLVPDEHNILFELSATDGSDTWISNFYITAHAPVLEMGDFTISGNGTIDPGETVDITVTVENSGSSDALNVLGELLSSDPFLTINTEQQSYGNLTAGTLEDQIFSISANANTPAGHLADFEFNIEAEFGISGSGTFNVVIGQIPILILDLDGNGNSSPEMEAVFNNIEIAFEKLSAFPPDLNLYSSVFVCLGIYSSNHTLTADEGQTLANYLNNGGNLYMEGGDTWVWDTQTAVHPMFHINGLMDGNDDMATVAGQSGTFTEGMSFNYSGDNNWMDHIEPVSPAFLIFENESPVYGTGVAYDEGSYRTIGTSHEFGGLDDGASPSTKEELMAEYLNFFGLSETLQAMFYAGSTEICEGESVEFTDISTGEVVSWEWTFEGGSPSTSSNQNPMIDYSDQGIFDVTLTVSDGTDSNTITFEDYITVNTCTNVTDGVEQSWVEIYPNPSNSRFIVKFNNNIGQTQITVLNLLNEIIFENSTETVMGNAVNIDLSNYPVGVYFVRIKANNSEQVRKIVIQ